MYICPICQQSFETEEAVSKHLMKCWREEHPYHKAKAAPQSDEVVTRKVNKDVLDFFGKFQKG